MTFILYLKYFSFTLAQEMRRKCICWNISYFIDSAQLTNIQRLATYNILHSRVVKKNYETYYRSARVQVWTILNDFEVFELFWIIFLFYLCLFWTTYFSDYLWSYQPTSGYPAITGYIWISWAMFISVNNFEVFWTIYNHFLVLLCSISIYLKLSLVISGSGDILGYLGLS